MTRYKTAQVLAGVSAVGFLLAAGLHTTEYRRVVLRAQQGFAGLAPFVATLWLTFAAALVILGLIVTLVAFGRVTPGRSILALAACFPAVTVVPSSHRGPATAFSRVHAAGRHFLGRRGDEFRRGADVPDRPTACAPTDFARSLSTISPRKATWTLSCFSSHS